MALAQTAQNGLKYKSMPGTNSDAAFRFERTFWAARHRMLAVLARPLHVSSAELAAIDSDTGLFCEHCGFTGECSICGQIHRQAAAA